MTIQKPDFNQIFASQAPDVDKPPVFNNYNGGWGDESRPNNGKPTIKGFNYLQQLNDNKFLWMAQNGAFPYDSNIEYSVGVVTIKDGRFKQWDGSSWINFGQDDDALKSINNLSDLESKEIARKNLEVPVSKNYNIATDFNTITETGFYGIAATNNPNAPISAWGGLRVINNGKPLSTIVIYQEFFSTSQGAYRFFRRVNVSGVWSNWIESESPDATETTAGKAKIATTAIAQAGVNNTDIMTPLKTLGLFNLKSLGVDQTWQNFTTVRKSGTYYTNTTSKPIQVYIKGTSNGGKININDTGDMLTHGNGMSLFIIPVGATYVFTGGFDAWWELR